MESDWQDQILMVIPSINGGHLLERMLPTLRFKPSNIIVLDQGSSDDTIRICEAAGVELMQLGQPHTYTQASNIGARMARQRGYPFICISNNDITFRTDVLFELLGEMKRDSRLGIVAPSQIILDPSSNVDVLARRVSWDLKTVEFLHDFSAAPATPRIEADFCELTCALIRMSAVSEVGFLDDIFGFYHEDADFCFRLRKAGFGAAYLPRSQIYHFTSSTFSKKREAQIDYLRRNRIRFASKHLGYGIRLAKDYSGWVSETETFSHRLQPILQRFGLIDDAGPELTIGRIGSATTGYLLTTQRSLGVAAAELAGKTILATSAALVDDLRQRGHTSFRIPLGIDPDIFNPWGPVSDQANRRMNETTYLAFANVHEPRTIEHLLQAWRYFVAAGQRAKLIVVGSRLQRRIGRTPDAAYRSGQVEISCYAVEQLELHESDKPLSDEALASLYRSADFTIVVKAEGESIALLESLACGTLVIFDAASGAIATSYHEATGGATSLNADDAQALRSEDTGPTAIGLLAALERSARLDAEERSALAMSAAYGVLGHSTLRHTAIALRDALEMTQVRNSDQWVKQLEQRAVRPLDRQIAAHPGESAPKWSRLSAGTARQLTIVASLAQRFGMVWQHKGLPAAVRLSFSRIRTVATGRILPMQARLTPNRNPAPLMVRAKSAGRPRQASPLLIGYIDAQLGIGQSLRGLAYAMAETEIAFSIYPFGIGVEGRRSVPMMPERYDEVTPHDINIIEVSPAELPRVFEHISPDHFAGSYNILRTYWELAKGPAVWRENHCMDRIDEIWAPNAFCAEAFKDFFDGPIVIVPPCLGIAGPSPTAHCRERFGLKPDIFYFMFSFDYYSFPERKNPLAVVRAFLAAFAEFDRPVGLVVKATSAAGHFPAVKQAILAAARADGRITIIDASLSREDMLALMASIDCYVSLHRSEGFGLGMAEAMVLQKPVIATCYSGSFEFVTERTGYPIPYTLTPLRAGEYVHIEGQVWADPDEDECAAAMRDVVENPAKAAARAKAGREFVAVRYGAANVGHIVAGRLEEIRNRITTAPASASNAEHAPS